MKMASCTCCVSAIISFREPAARPQEIPSGAPGSFGSKLVIGRATSREDVFGIVHMKIAPSFLQKWVHIGKTGEG